MSELVQVVREEDGIRILWLVDNASKNALHPRFVDALMRGLREVGDDHDARVCIVRGLADVFCSGGDQGTLLALAAGEHAPSDLVLTKLMIDVPIPTIAAMEGHAVGGGLALGLACDLVFLARESRYGCSFMNLGFTPGMGITRLLQAAVGEYLAAEMMFGGQFVRGAQLTGRGSINEVLPRAQVFERALDVARRIASKPRPALVMLKRCLSMGRRRAFEESHTIETLMHEVCFGWPETADRIRENFTTTGAHDVG